MGKSKYVVTITRQFGSMGRPIAKKMAEKLGIEYYDRDIVDQAAKKLNLPVSVVDEVEETAKKVKASPFARMMFPLEKGPAIHRIRSLRRSRISLNFLRKKRHVLLSEGVRILLWKRWKMPCIFTFMHHMRFVWSIV